MDLKRLFGRVFTLGNIRDHITFAEGNDTLDLTVDESPARIISGLMAIKDKMGALGENASQEEETEAALDFAIVIFGHEQAQEIMRFYRGNGEYVMRICEKYFNRRLRGLILKQQKKSKK